MAWSLRTAIVAWTSTRSRRTTTRITHTTRSHRTFPIRSYRSWNSWLLATSSWSPNFKSRAPLVIILVIFFILFRSFIGRPPSRSVFSEQYWMLFMVDPYDPYDPYDVFWKHGFLVENFYYDFHIMIFNRLIGRLSLDSYDSLFLSVRTFCTFRSPDYLFLSSSQYYRLSTEKCFGNRFIFWSY